jgi:hypothetical protein
MIETTLRLLPRNIFRGICSVVLACIFALSTSSFINYERASARYTTSSLPPVIFSLATDPQSDAQPKPSSPARADAQPVKPSRSDVSVPSGEAHVDVVRQYLWDVYERASAKLDSHGDFTWKDAAAAARLGLTTEEYVIGGMDPDFREQLFSAGQAMDAAGIDWTILSAFRDDYRQDLAVGFKAQTGNSFHGGSVATGGYGHGCAADLVSTDGLSNVAVWNWLDQHGEQFGLRRPLRQIDPAHIQTSAGWHDLAATLRDERTEIDPALTATPATGDAPGEPVSPSSTVATSVERSSNAGLSQEQYNCVRPRPPEEPVRQAIVSRMKAIITVLPAAVAGRNRARTQERTAGAGPHRANARHSPADSLSRHAKLKASARLAG